MAKSKAEVNFMEHLKPLLPAGGDASELEAAAQALAGLSPEDRDLLAAVQESPYRLTTLDQFREFPANTEYFVLEPNISKVEDVGWRYLAQHLDVLLSRLYEDFVLGDLSKERYKKMTADYEAEQERLKLEIEVTEEWLETQETMSADVDAFVALTQKYVDVPELTPTIVNEYIKKIEVFPPDKSSGKRVQKVKIYFNFVDDVEIPVISEPVVAKSTPGRRKTA